MGGSRTAAIALTLALGLAPACSRGEPEADARRDFARWLEDDLWPDARDRGVSRATFEAALAGVGPAPEGDAPGQAEFQTPAEYFDPARMEALVDLGRERLRRWRTVLGEIEQRTGVPPQVVVAIWGRESSYGRAPLRHDAVEVLAQRAWHGPRRPVFRGELLAALELLESGEVDAGRLRSSSAGALGQPQFLPSQLQRHAVDHDGDGRRDIWDSVPDVLASIANYLQQHGWQRGRDWGYEVELPSALPCTLEGPDRVRPLAAWREQGVTRTRGRRFPVADLDREAYLVLPAGRLGPAFLATPNFAALKDYNRADLYALYVGLLADRLLGERGFAGEWQPVAPLERAQVRALQRELDGAGYDVGGVDGLIGFRTRTALGSAQQRAGLDPTCFPTPEGS